MLVDSHCHLDFPEFEADLDAVVARARNAGIGCILTICTRATAIGKTLAIAERYDDVYAAVGIHPHNVEEQGVFSVDEIAAWTEHSKVVGIGETGLDYFYEHSPREEQRESFRAHIAAARSAGLPIIVHSRDAEEETLEILAEEQGKGAFAGVIHCFSGSAAFAEGALALGMSISLAGILTFKKAEDLRKTAGKIPLERLLVETDSPYLAPIPKRGKRNEPAFVAHTAALLAEIKGVAPAELAAITTENFFRLFSRAERSLAA